MLVDIPLLEWAAMNSNTKKTESCFSPGWNPGIVSLLSTLALLVGFLLNPAVANAQESQPEPTIRTDLSPQAAEAARILNQIRVDAGLPPLVVEPLLNLAVTAHIHDMITSGVYGHTGSDGANVHQRIARTGYQVDGWAGENWAVSKSVAESIDWWMADPPHRENVLNSYYTAMGLGVWPHPGGWGDILVVDFTTGGKAVEPVNVDSSVVAEVVSVTVTEEPEPSTAEVETLPQSEGTGEAREALTVSGTSYVVQAGDTLWQIGSITGLGWQEIARLNGLNEHSILSIGTTLKLAEEEESVVDEGIFELTSVGVYTVQPGDTLSLIAQLHDLSWQSLAAFNGMGGSEILQIGQELLIPGIP